MSELDLFIHVLKTTENPDLRKQVVDILILDYKREQLRKQVKPSILNQIVDKISRRK